jgi:hypothetical protein
MNLKLTVMRNWKRLLNCNIIVNMICLFYSNANGMTPLIEELE